MGMPKVINLLSALEVQASQMSVFMGFLKIFVKEILYAKRKMCTCTVKILHFSCFKAILGHFCKLIQHA